MSVHHTEEERLMLRRVLACFRDHGWRDRDSTAVAIARALCRPDCTTKMISEKVQRDFITWNRATAERVTEAVAGLLADPVADPDR